MDIWEKLYEAAKLEYHPEEVSPFIDAHHVVAAIEAEDGTIYSGFCIEGASGVIALCAERVAGLKMYMMSGQKVAKRMIAFRSEPPRGNGGMPCGACREFFMQLSQKNKDMEILINYDTKETVKLIDLLPSWWGWKRYEQSQGENQ